MNPQNLNFPYNLSALFTKDNTIRLSWKWEGKEDDIEGFIIEKKTDETEGFREIVSRGKSERDYEDTAITDDITTYAYRAFAFKDKKRSIYSNEVVVNIVLKEIVLKPPVEEKPKPEPTGTGIVKKPEKTGISLRLPAAEKSGKHAWLEPNYLIAEKNDSFSTALHLNTGSEKLTSFDIIVSYPKELMKPDAGKGEKGITMGIGDFSLSVDAKEEGYLTVEGTSGNGIGPLPDVHLLSIHFIALKPGVSTLKIGLIEVKSKKKALFEKPFSIEGVVGIADTKEALIANGNQGDYQSQSGYDNQYGGDNQPGNDGEGVWEENAGDEYIARNDDDYRDYDEYGNDDQPPYEDNYSTQPPGPGNAGKTDAPTGPPRRTDAYYEEPVYTDAPTAPPVVTATATPSPTPTDTPSPSPSPKATSAPAPAAPGTGEVWIEPASGSVSMGARFSNEVHVNSGNQKIAAYGIEIGFDSGILNVNTGVGNKGVEAGPQGFVAAVNLTPGRLVIGGFDTSGKGPGEDLYLLRLNWTAVGTGTATISVTVKDLTDANTDPIGNKRGISARVTVK
ncbi:MAG: hypothetical protein JW881_03735 [Spirochaetales bacterium]|nr:hypothetical protein [Spirochaetales bacterium]